MLTNKKRIGHGLNIFVLSLLAAWLAGCTPPGPRALLQGKRLVERGDYPAAVEQLRLATTLLPTNALAWNYLGLACHLAGQPADAIDAYQKALKLNHDLVIVHYDLGCVLLEQNKPAYNEAARDELTAFVLHQGNSLDGRLKLGTAQLRLGDLAGAENSFKEALRISSENCEAINDLGVVQLHRRRYSDAVAYFKAALKQQPAHPAALLNLAVTYHLLPNTHAQALQCYQQYLAINPRPANWDAADAAAKQLDAELNPVPISRPAVTSPVVAVPVSAPPMEKPPKPVVASAPPRVVAVAPAPKPVEPAPQPKPVVVASAKPPPTAPQIPPSQPDIIVQPEVVQVTESPSIKTAQDSPVAAPAPSVAVATTPAPVPPPAQSAATNPATRRSFLNRMNPFTRDSSSEPPAQPAGQGIGVVSTNPGGVSKTSAAVTEPAAPTARYAYLSPPRPAPGNRVEAERLFGLALQAQRDHRNSEAVTIYRQAVQADPSFFEAQSNLGLAAYDVGDMPLALSAYEMALAITPDSFNARFNFALALKKANYLVDAAHELERLLIVNPTESPAHLSATHLLLANLYAEQFHQPNAARPHYLKVLQLDPANPQAMAIRYWLRDNP